MLLRLLGWAVLTLCAVSGAEGAVIMTLEQVGPNVVLNGSGTANLAALTLEQTGGCAATGPRVWLAGRGVARSRAQAEDAENRCRPAPASIRYSGQ